MKIHKYIVIQAPAQTVFECVSDAALIPQWMEELESIHFPQPINPVQPIGTRFSQRLREGIGVRTYQGRVEVYREYEQFSVTFTDRRFHFRLDYFIQVEERGTVLRYRLENSRENFLTFLAGGLVEGMTEKMVINNLRNLKAFAERQAG